MASQRQIDVWAQALVEASIVGDLPTAEKYKVTERTLRNWRRWVKTDPELRRLYEEKMSRVGAEFSDSLTTRPALVALRGRRPKAAPDAARRKQMSRALADAAADEIVAVAALCGLPEVKSAERGHVLPSGHIISLLVSHRDGSYTVCDFLTAGSSHSSGRVLGHLLFCFESVRMHYRLPASLIRLCVLADHDAPPLWNRVVASVGVKVGFCNILDVVRSRLAAHNVMGCEPAQAAGAPSP